MRGGPGDRYHAPDHVVDHIGEDPARYLDRTLVETGPEHTNRTSKRLVEARIRGIDHIATARAWIAIERKLDRGPRDYVIKLLEHRLDELEEHGERDLPGRTPDELRERSRALFEAVDGQKATQQLDDDTQTAAQKVSQLRARTDGGNTDER